MTDFLRKALSGLGGYARKKRRLISKKTGPKKGMKRRSFLGF